MCSRCASLCHVKLTKYVSLAALCVSAMHSSIRSIAVQRCTSSYWHRHSHRRLLLRWPLTRRSSHHSKLLGTVTIPYLTNHRQLLQRIVLLLGILVLCRALKLVLGTLARSSSVRTAHVLLCAASRDTVNIFWVEPNVVGVLTLLCGGRVKEPTARTGFQSAHTADRA